MITAKIVFWLSVLHEHGWLTFGEHVAQFYMNIRTWLAFSHGRSKPFEIHVEERLHGGQFGLRRVLRMDQERDVLQQEVVWS